MREEDGGIPFKHRLSAHNSTPNASPSLDRSPLLLVCTANHYPSCIREKKSGFILLSSMHPPATIQKERKPNNNGHGATTLSFPPFVRVKSHHHRYSRNSSIVRNALHFHQKSNREKTRDPPHMLMHTHTHAPVHYIALRTQQQQK